MNEPILVQFKSDKTKDGKFCRKGIKNSLLQTKTYSLHIIDDHNEQIYISAQEIYDLAKQNKELKRKLVLKSI